LFGCQRMGMRSGLGLVLELRVVDLEVMVLGLVAPRAMKTVLSVWMIGRSVLRWRRV
jgi:hypothetical protein